MKNLTERTRHHAGLNPVVEKNVGHLFTTLFITASIAGFLMLGLGLPGLILFVEWYASFVALLAIFLVLPYAIYQTIMNTWRKSRNIPHQTLCQTLFSFLDPIRDFALLLPYFHTARFVFMIVAYAFLAAIEAAPQNSSFEALTLMIQASVTLMIIASAIVSMVADAIPLLIMIRFRKDAAQ